MSGKAEAERFDNAVRKIFSVAKDDLLKPEAKQRRARGQKKRAKKPAWLSRIFLRDDAVECLGTLPNAGLIAVNPAAPTCWAGASMPVFLTHKYNRGVTPSLAKLWVALIVSSAVEGKLTPSVPTNARVSLKPCPVVNLPPEPPFGWATFPRNMVQTRSQFCQL